MGNKKDNRWFQLTMKQTTYILVAFTILFSSCTKEDQEELDLSNYHPNLSMDERIKKEDPYFLEGQWVTGKIYSWDSDDSRTNLDVTEVLTISKTHWMTSEYSAPYHIIFEFYCGVRVPHVYVAIEGQMRKIRVLRISESGTTHLPFIDFGPGQFEFATTEKIPNQSNPWRIDKAYTRLP